VPGAQENANRRATGDSAIDWIDHSAKLLPNFGRPIKALSIGCGFGPIGRILRRRDYCQLIHSIDVAESAIAAARKAAAAEGLDGFAESWTNASPASETASAKRPKLNSWRTN
jgi:16S rRNA G1207 methylase RsmC